MAEYFTSDHFKLLNKWKGQKRDDSNPEQNRAYEELKKAYDITEAWANGVRARLFPMARPVELRKRPTNQGNNFAAYNWARIYPSQEAPKELAYTVGIDAEAGFVVKIDTVQADPDLRARYEAIRGPYDGSPIVAMLPVQDGLSKSLAELVNWSVEAIRNFKLRYDDVAAKLNLGKTLSDEDLLKHFDGKPAFKTFRASWSAEDEALFCRLARIVHAAGLDWWHTNIGIQVRFGRKNPGNERAIGVLGVIDGARVRTIRLRRALGGLPMLEREPITEELIARLETALATDHETLDDWLKGDAERPGLWPDQLRDDPVESDDDGDEDEIPCMNPTPIQPINRIYYGPPGTGKTYELSRLLKKDYEQATATMSVDAWRRQFIDERIASRKCTWWEAALLALYESGGEADINEILNHPFFVAIAAVKGSKGSLRQTVETSLREHTIRESRTVQQELRYPPQVFDRNPGAVWRLADDWQDACADLVALVNDYRAGAQSSSGVLQRYSFVTFHQSYGYEEFVEGLRPILASDEDAGEIQYEIRPGVFKELCRKARQAPGERFAMVIDEINRGNISKIFGELITLIEADKREGAENAVSVTLPYSGETFSVPANVDIIGTMNTADRSLALLDTALRRRFDFVPVLPDARDEAGAPLCGLRVSAGEQVIDIPRLLSAINERVEALYDRDHCIGHAYFTPLAQVPDGDDRFIALAQVFSNRILPLLEEYFFEDWQKIRLVLADNQKPLAAQFIAEGQDQQDDLARLFGGDHGLDSYATRRRYTVQASAFSNPDAYIGVYRTLAP